MGDDNRGPLLAAVTSVLLGLAVLFTSLRFYVKCFLTKSWAADDALLLISLIFFILFCVGSIVGVSYGTGQRLVDIEIQNVPTALKLWYLGELWYTLTTCFVRLSIAVFLFRLATKPMHKLVIYVAIGVNIVLSLVFFFMAVFQCRPVGYFWKQYTGTKGSCFGPDVIPSASIAHSVVSFCVDWVLGFLPFAILYDLEMRTRTKVSVGLLLSMGLLAGIATLIRIPQIHALAITDDWLYKTVNVAIWSTVEPGLGIMAIAGATFRPLFRSFFSTRSGTQTGMTTYHTHNGTQLDQWRGSPMSCKRPSTAAGLSVTFPYNAVQERSSATPTPTPQNDDKIARSPVSANFDFAFEDKTRTMTSTQSSPFSDRNELRTPTSPTFRFPSPQIQYEVADRGSRVWVPTSLQVPRMDGITVQRTVEIHEDLHDETPEGFLRSEIGSIGMGSVSSRSSIKDGRAPSLHRIGRQDSMTIIREDGMISRPGMRAEWDVVRPGTAKSDVSIPRSATARSEFVGMRDGSSLEITRSENGPPSGNVCSMDAFI